MATGETIPPRLVVTSPAEMAGTVLPLAAAEQVIGHSDTADLVLQDRFVSRRHALMTVDPAGQVTIRDLNSTGGTFVNEERLTAARLLTAGDQVRFADLVATFEPAAQPADPSVTQVLPVVKAPPVEPPAPPAGPAQPAGQSGLPPPVAVGTASLYTVTGTVASPALPGVAGLTVRLVDKNVGGDQVLATTQTQSGGGYAFTQVPISSGYLAQFRKAEPDLQAQVYSGDTFLAASAVSYSAPVTLTLDVVLPAGAAGLPSEYEILTASLGSAYAGSLAGLKEGNGSADITYLANKTGWDARAVALAALADQFSQLTATAPPPPGAADTGQTQAWPVPAVSVPPEFYYALFRAGLPASADTLFQASPDTVTGIWQQAIAANVIPQSLVKSLPSATTAFQAVSAAQRLTAAPPAGLSTLSEMLAPVLPAAAQQQQFATLYAQHQGDWASLWPAVAQTLGQQAATALQLSGQLLYLTVNNQPLVTALTQAQASEPLASAADLASRGYYDPARWQPLIGQNVPPGMPGDAAAEQAANYAQLLAAQVRVAFPTAVLADQVSRGMLPVTGGPNLAGSVAGFLAGASSQAQFEIGVEPVEGFLARTGYAAPAAEVVTAVKRLQRVYQLTPDDASMAVLLNHNLDSAFAVTRYGAAGFARAFGDELGGTDTAAAIYQRARQVFGSVLSVAIGYLGGRVAPPIGGSNPVQLGYPPQQGAPSYPVTAYPTLEDLFGSLDYCGCSDCGSILSPAAYLVDLLNYLDQPAPSAGGANPQEILLQRRPDLAYLPLTCPNTNTALPYIDLVNETLEYMVANGLSLAGYQGHDTGETITSAELIASPQYVDDAAYQVLQGAYFPPPLPFSRPLTLLRLQLASLGIALPDAMTALRSGDQLTSDQTPVSYGWQDILIERLGISRDEYRLYTDPLLELSDLYGLPASPAPLGVLQTASLQDLSRRLSVSYDDLSAIVSTQFINPDAGLLPRLEQLNAPFATLQALHDNLGTAQSIAADFIAALPAGLDATQYGGTSPADYQAVVDWVTSPQVYPKVMDIVTISAPAGSVTDCSGADLQLRYSNPDPAANLLSGTDFIRLIRFIRLWRALAPLLGDASDAVTIAQTDAIIAALYPAADIPAGTSDTANDPANRALLDAGFAALLPRAGLLLWLLGQLGLTADAGLAQLLACWAPIGTTGQWSLYQAMFLTPALLQQDPGARTATVAATVSPGDVLDTSVNGVDVSYTVAGGDTAVTAATAIAAAINAETTPDPASGLPLNKRFTATASGAVITIIAGCTLAVTASAPPPATTATETAAAAGTPAAWSVTVGGTATAGDVVTATIDTVPVSYTVQAGDALADVAAGLAAAINAATTADPYSGLPLNGLVAAASAGAVLTVIAAGAAAPFALTCTDDPASAGSYLTGPLTPQLTATATITGSIPAGAMLTTTINTIPVCYQAIPGDTPASIAAAIAAAVNAAAAVDPDTGLALNALVTASAAGGALTLAGNVPAAPFTLAVELAAGGYTAGRAAPPFAGDGYGDYLADPAQTLLAHQPALCAACNLTGAEFTLITQALGYDASTPLTLGAVSAVFRYGWLAHTLGLSVRAFGLLRSATGLDPFAPLQLGTVPPVLPPVAGFIALLSALTTAGEDVTAALYLIWNDDLNGSSAPPQADITGLAAALTADFAAVDAQFTVTDDPDGSIAEGLMTLVYGSSATDFFFGLLNGTLTTSVSYLAPSGALPDALVTASGGRISYDDLARQLSFGGLLDATLLTTIDAAIPAGDTATGPALASLATASQGKAAPFFAAYPELEPLLVTFEASADPVQTRRATLLAGFLPILAARRNQEQALAAITAAAGTDPSFATALLSDPAILHADADATQPASADLTGVASQGLTAMFYLGNDPSAPPDQVTDSVSQLSYGPPAGQSLPGGGSPITVILTGYLSAPQDGDYDLSVTADTGATVTLALNGAAVPLALSGGAWTNTGPVTLTAGQLVPVTLTATSVTATLRVSWRSLGLPWQVIPPQSLYAQSLVDRLGHTYLRFLKVTSLASALSLTAADTAWLATVPALAIGGVGWLNALAVTGPPPPSASASLTGALTAALDFARLKQALSPADERLLAVLTDPAATLPGGQSALLSLTGWDSASLNALLTQFFGSTDPASLADVTSLARVYDAFSVVSACGLTASAVIAAITNAPTDATVSALQSALRAKYAPADWLTAVGPINDAARTAQRDALVAYILQQLGDSYAGSLASLATSAAASTGDTQLAFAATAGLSAGMSIQCAGVATGTAVASLTATSVTLSLPLLAALPAGSALTFIPAGAQQVATADDLYASLLIDTQTQPPVLTSRIRLALSAIQLFAERVIRNLEPQVAPGDIDAGQWEWMKRYRVWQANREVFLWPENWLYPELRDDASPLFQQMMTGLLQGDITDDAAAAAYLTYLTGLEEVAKLEPCGLHYEPGGAVSDDVNYVVARTAGAHRKYYFRQLSAGSWTPWAQVQIECEDMPITPLVWNGRLFLFWLKLTKQGQQQQANTSSLPSGPVANYQIGDMQNYASAADSGQNTVAVSAVLCWTEYYNGSWQPTKTSDVNRPSSIGGYAATGPGAFEEYRNQVRIVPAQYTGSSRQAQSLLLPGQFTLPAQSLMLSVSVAGSTSPAGFILHNTHSLPVIFDDVQLVGLSEQTIIDGTIVVPLLIPVPLSSVLDLPSPSRGVPSIVPYTGTYSAGTFAVSYAEEAGTPSIYANSILGYAWAPRFVDTQPGLAGAWDAPFIYEDRRNMFHVTTTQSFVPIWQFGGFGLLQASPGAAAWAGHVPGLVLTRPVTPATPREVLAVSAAASPAAMQRFLASATTISAALPATLTVAYQGQVISPVGSLAALRPAAGQTQEG